MIIVLTIHSVLTCVLAINSWMRTTALSAQIVTHDAILAATQSHATAVMTFDVLHVQPTTASATEDASLMPHTTTQQSSVSATSSLICHHTTAAMKTAFSAVTPQGHVMFVLSFGSEAIAM